MRMAVARRGRSNCSWQRVARGRRGGELLLRLRLTELAGRGLLRAEIEGGTGHQHVQLESQHAHRLTVPDRIDRGEIHLTGIHDRYATAAFDLDHLVGADEGGGVFVESDADRERVVGQRRQQPSQPVALAEVLVDDEAVGESESRRELHAAGDHGRAFIAGRDHVLAEDAGAGTGAPDGDPARVAQSDQLRYRRTAEQCRQTQLVAAGEEDAARRLQALQPSGLLAVAAGIEIHHGHAPGAQLLEQLFITRSGLMGATGRGNDHDVSLIRPRDTHEALEDVAVIFLILRAADGHDPATALTVGNLARHPSLTSLITVPGLTLPRLSGGDSATYAGPAPRWRAPRLRPHATRVAQCVAAARPRAARPSPA